VSKKLKRRAVGMSQIKIHVSDVVTMERVKVMPVAMDNAAMKAKKTTTKKNNR
jgi:hypothetical protein